jgi:hypothetical protein
MHFTDGSSGVVDLAERVVGRGVLRPLEDRSFFFKLPSTRGDPGCATAP